MFTPASSRSAEILERTLLPGERVVWSGAPHGSLIRSVNNPNLFKGLGALLLLGVIALFLAVIVNPTVGSSGDQTRSETWSRFDPLIDIIDASGAIVMGLTEVVIGIIGFNGAVVLGWIIVRAYLRDRATVYAVTDRRVLIVRAAPFDTIHAYSKPELTRVKFERQEDYGSLRFTVKKAPYAHKVWRGQDDGFYRLVDAESAGKAIEEALDFRVDGLHASKKAPEKKTKEPSASMLIQTRSGEILDMREVVGELERDGYTYAQISDFKAYKISLDDLRKQRPEGKSKT